MVKPSMAKEQSANKLLAQEWLKKGEEDELTVQSLLKHRDGAPSSVCFLSQQIAEKYLKACLVFHKKKFPKTHLLEHLLELCLEINISFKELQKEVVLLDTFYVPTRYPGDYPEFTWNKAEIASQAASKIKKAVSAKIKI